MKLTVARLGQHFGTLAKVRGIVIHTLSPFEQRAFAGAISKGIPNTLRRINSEIFYVVPRKLKEFWKFCISDLIFFFQLSFMATLSTTGLSLFTPPTCARTQPILKMMCKFPSMKSVNK